MEYNVYVREGVGWGGGYVLDMLQIIGGNVTFENENEKAKGNCPFSFHALLLFWIQCEKHKWAVRTATTVKQTQKRQNREREREGDGERDCTNKQKSEEVRRLAVYKKKKNRKANGMISFKNE